uniref:Coiled-coil domain containing 171 n=1 Tax=Oryzias melastigma TaxID=30732 RepID=A0A3B3DZU2_ORYME
ILGDFTWEELCGVISEQAEQLTSDLQEANRQVRGGSITDYSCKDRSLRLRDLQRSQETTLTQLEERVRRREEAWRRRHTQTQKVVVLFVSCCVFLMFVQLCRSQCVALRDHASSLEQRCSSLTSDLSGAQKERSSSLLACALLSGALSHAHRRLSALSQQKRLLCRRLEEKEQLEEEVRRLAEALGGENEEQDKGGRTALRRWRRSMCAVLVARRWSLLARKTQVVFRVERGGATVCVCADPATAATKGQDSSQTDGVCARWLQSQQLSSAVLASMSDLRGALTLSGNHTLEDPHPSQTEEIKNISLFLTPEALVSTLQQHFLLFSQRLHSAEVERRSLRVEVANLKRGLRRETEFLLKKSQADQTALNSYHYGSCFSLFIKCFTFLPPSPVSCVWVHYNSMM